MQTFINSYDFFEEKNNASSHFSFPMEYIKYGLSNAQLIILCKNWKNNTANVKFQFLLDDFVFFGLLLL